MGSKNKGIFKTKKLITPIKVASPITNELIAKCSKKLYFLKTNFKDTLKGIIDNIQKYLK